MREGRGGEGRGGEGRGGEGRRGEGRGREGEGRERSCYLLFSSHEDSSLSGARDISLLIHFLPQQTLTN